MTTKLDEGKEKTAEEYFLSRLRELDRGEIAILKRNAGNTIAESRGTYKIFYRIFPPWISNSRNEEVFFLIATLYGLNDYAIKGDFGTTMRWVKAKSPTDSLDHRISVLLDSDFDLIEGYRPGGGEMAYRLRQCVKLANGHGIGVDWPKLLGDLQRWQYPEKRVQKAWARSYFGHEKPNEEEQKNQ
jgi:CRISPR system Cascade subunit CasB